MRAERRAVLRLAAGALAALALPATAHVELGPVLPPAPLPDTPLLLHDGRRARLAGLLQGQCSALQLMFTSCSAVCPLQGALFPALQQALGAAPVQLLSLSIDVLGDDAPALAGWRRRFRAGPNWQAAVPAGAAACDTLLGALGQRASSAEGHNGQVFLLDRQARLAYRSSDLPAVAELTGALARLAAR